MGQPYLSLPVVGRLREELLAWADLKVPDSALTDKGREQSPHITLFYGLPSEEHLVERALQDATRGMSSFKTTITNAGFFHHSDKSVLVLNCKSGGALGAIVTALSSRFRKTYRLNAHITLAYVRKGYSVRTADLMRFVGRTVESDHLVYHRVDKSTLEFYP